MTLTHMLLNVIHSFILQLNTGNESEVIGVTDYESVLKMCNNNIVNVTTCPNYNKLLKRFNDIVIGRNN